ncbi:immunity protein Imm33 domain-containing protein [Anaerotignum sp.]|uniref:immunity protein Imm33 domain-containing protein n=1 Tax=Anaerotignum sp. TaxID=2039241 RepID=UPI002A920BFA|nr:DUF2185 domain-containing protein [Anaerotignum sp.]MCI7657665.1 DUF2185 domain-containing protein [Clostridia bacterium]MDY5415444.1 DUF2185 domain-containing protein [Anaerotignum sp.]
MGKNKILQKKTEQTKEKRSNVMEKAEQRQERHPLGACIVTKSVLNKTAKLKWIFREYNGIGTGWVVLGDTDTQEYINQAENFSMVDFTVLAEIEPLVMRIFYMPAGSDLEFCCDETGKYFVDTRTGKKIREVVKHPVQAAFEKNLRFLNKENYDVLFFQNLFRETKNIKTVQMGQGDFPTGSVVLADPFAYLGNTKYQTVLEKSIPKGSYAVELSIMHSDLVGLRIAAAKLKISDQQSVRYEIAMPKGSTIADFNKPGVFSFFGVDTGLACFCDESLAEKYAEFSNTWHKEHGNKNIYHDYFSRLFEDSCKNTPDLQTVSGGFLLWNLPQSSEKIPMFSSGMGDGIYSAYWGFDKDNEIVELIIPFMKPEYF